MTRFKETEPSTPSLPFDAPMDPGEDLPERPSSREGRTQAMMRLMIATRWRTGSGPESTAYQLAERWNMSLDSIQRISSEASRRVRDIIDPTPVRERICAALDEGISRAMEKNDLKNLASLARVYSEVIGLSGIAATKRLEILQGKGASSPALPPALAGLNPPPTPEEVLAYANTGKVPVREPAPIH